jgi:hypothetical protein
MAIHHRAPGIPRMKNNNVFHSVIQCISFSHSSIEKNIEYALIYKLEESYIILYVLVLDL